MLMQNYTIDGSQAFPLRQETGGRPDRMPAGRLPKLTSGKTRPAVRGVARKRMLTGESLVYLEAVNASYLIPVAAITIIEAEHKKAKVYFRAKAVTLSVSLQYLETRLPAELFVRANRSQILNVRAVAKADELVDGTIQLTLQDGFSGSVLLSRRQSVLFKHRCAL